MRRFEAKALLREKNVFKALQIFMPNTASPSVITISYLDLFRLISAKQKPFIMLIFNHSCKQNSFPKIILIKSLKEFHEKDILLSKQTFKYFLLSTVRVVQPSLKHPHFPHEFCISLIKKKHPFMEIHFMIWIFLEFPLISTRSSKEKLKIIERFLFQRREFTLFSKYPLIFRTKLEMNSKFLTKGVRKETSVTT